MVVLWDVYAASKLMYLNPTICTSPCCQSCMPLIDDPFKIGLNMVDVEIFTPSSSSEGYEATPHLDGMLEVQRVHFYGGVHFCLICYSSAIQLNVSSLHKIAFIFNRNGLLTFHKYTNWLYLTNYKPKSVMRIHSWIWKILASNKLVHQYNVHCMCTWTCTMYKYNVWTWALIR